MTYPRYSQIRDALHELFVAVPGLAQLDEDGAAVNILKYEPRSIQTSPTLYSLLDTFERSTAGQKTTMRYRILHRLVFQWQDNEASEGQLDQFIHSLPAAVDADPTLGGLVDSGLARIADGSTGFVVISQTKYRCIDFFSDVLTKAPYKSGI